MARTLPAINTAYIPSLPTRNRLVASSQQGSTGPVNKTRASTQRARVAHKALMEAVALANTVAGYSGTKLSFHYDERIDQVVVQVIQGATAQVIRQIPPEEIVELMAKWRTDLRGVLFHHTG